MHTHKKGPEMGLVHAQSEAMKDVFTRCHKKTAVQVCTLTIMHYCLVTVNTDAMIARASFQYWQTDLTALCMCRM